MLGVVGAALLAGLTPGPPGAEPPPPLVSVTGGVLAFVERRGDYHMRHVAMGYAVADDGAFGATGSYDGTAVVWDLRDGRAIRVFATPHINVNAVALSRDGSRLATGGGVDGTVRMWDVRSGRELWSSKHDADALRFSPDGRRLIGRRLDEYRVWEVSDGRLVWSGLSHRSGSGGWPGAFGTIVTPDGRSAIELVVTGWHGAGGGDDFYSVPDGYVATVIDLDRAAQTRVLSNPEDWPVALATSPSGDRVAIVGAKQLIVVDAASGRRLAAVARPDAGNPIVHRTGVLLVPDPRFAVTWDLDELVVWDLPAGKPAWRKRRGRDDSAPWLAGKETLFIREGEECVGLGVADGKTRWRRASCTGGGGSDTSNRILLARGPSALDVVDAAAGTSLVPAPIAQGPSGGIGGLTVSPDGHRVAGFGSDRSAWVWEAAGGARKLADAPDPLWYPVGRFLSDDRLAIVNQTRGDNRRIYRYAIGRNAIEAVVDVAKKDRFGGSGVLVGNRVILEEVREHDYVRTVVDLTGRAKPYHLPPWRRPPRHRPDFSLRNEALEPGGVTARLTRAYVVDNDDHIHAWDMRAGKVVTQVDAEYEFVAAVALSPDEKRLLVAYRKGGVSIRAASTLEEERRLEGPGAEIYTAAFAPDGKLVVAAGADGLFLWRVSDGARIATVDFSAAREAPGSLAFSPDGATLWVGTTLGNLHRFSLRP